MPARLEHMTDGEAAAYLRRSLEPYVDDRVAMGESPALARRTAEAQVSSMLPDGVPAPGHHHYRVVDDDGTAVGSVWIGPHAPEQPEAFWVWNVEIDEAHRGRGLGRAAMVLAEGEARAHGATDIGLNVFGVNAVARNLYTSVGYEITSLTMRKALR